MLHLYFTVIEVDGLPATAHWWASVDPYCVVTCGSQKFQSSVKKRSGGRAIYHESCTKPLEDTTITIEIKDKDHLSSDDSLARGTITVRATEGYCFLGPVPLRDKTGKDLSPRMTIALSIHDQ